MLVTKDLVDIFCIVTNIDVVSNVARIRVKIEFKVVMQYFFFEKYLMQPDSFVYINAILMLISSALFIKDLGQF